MRLHYYLIALGWLAQPTLAQTPAADSTKANRRAKMGVLFKKLGTGFTNVGEKTVGGAIQAVGSALSPASTGTPAKPASSPSDKQRTAQSAKPTGDPFNPTVPTVVNVNTLNRAPRLACGNTNMNSMGVQPIVFSPDESLLAGFAETSQTDDNVVKSVLLVDVATGQPTGQISLPEPKNGKYYLNNARLQFSKDGTQLAISGPTSVAMGGAVYVFIIRVADRKLTFAAFGDGEGLSMSGVSPNFQYALVGNKIWNLQTRTFQGIFSTDALVLLKDVVDVPRIVFGSLFLDDTRLAIATDQLVEVDLLTGKSRVVVEQKPSSSSGFPVACTTDGHVLFSDLTMVDWRQGGITRLPNDRNVQSVGVMFYDEGRKYMTNHVEKVCFWNRIQPAENRCITSEKAYVYTAISPSGRKLFAVDGEGDFNFTDLSTKPVANSATPVTKVVKYFRPSAFCFSHSEPTFYVATMAGHIKRVRLKTGEVSDLATIPVPIFGLSCYRNLGLLVQGSPMMDVPAGTYRSTHGLAMTPTKYEKGFDVYSFQFSDQQIIHAGKLPLTNEMRDQIDGSRFSLDRKLTLAEEEDGVIVRLAGRSDYVRFYFIADAPSDFLIMHSDGRFDGTPAGLKLLTGLNAGKVTAADTKQRPGFSPGLLKAYLADYLKTY